ncbi:hypothetical protein [Rhizobium sp. WL3]|nr:hypothetical protein [Rhizobium sp. WL3]
MDRERGFKGLSSIGFRHRKDASIRMADTKSASPRETRGLRKPTNDWGE